MTDAGRWGTRTVRWLHAAVFQSGTRGGPVPAPADRLITVPNAITVLRLLCLPVFGYLVIGRQAWLAALLLAWILASLDVIDGYVARRFNQVSRLGVALDPLVDRLTLAAMSIILALASIIAWWLATIVLMRDLILLSLLPAVLRGRMQVRVLHSEILG